MFQELKIKNNIKKEDWIETKEGWGEIRIDMEILSFTYQRYRMKVTVEVEQQRRTM